MDFDIIQTGTSPYLTSTLVFIILWSGVSVISAATLSFCGYLGVAIMGISYALFILWRYEKILVGPLVWFRFGEL